MGEYPLFSRQPVNATSTDRYCSVRWTMFIRLMTSNDEPVIAESSSFHDQHCRVSGNSGRRRVFGRNRAWQNWDATSWGVRADRWWAETSGVFLVFCSQRHDDHFQKLLHRNSVYKNSKWQEHTRTRGEMYLFIAGTFQETKSAHIRTNLMCDSEQSHWVSHSASVTTFI